MSNSQSAEELKEERIKVMGNDLGIIYNSIYNEVVWMSFKWAEYVELFATKQSRLAILNGSAPFFFYLTQKTLWNDILLGISRITDPATTKRKKEIKKNITLQALPPLIKDIDFKHIIIIKKDAILEQITYAKDWRNRHIAHKDFDISTQSPAVQFEKASKNKIDKSFFLLQEIINLFQKKYFNSTTIFKRSSIGGSIPLIRILDYGITYRNEMYELKFDYQKNKIKDI